MQDILRAVAPPFSYTKEDKSANPKLKLANKIGLGKKCDSKIVISNKIVKRDGTTVAPKKSRVQVSSMTTSKGNPTRTNKLKNTVSNITKKVAAKK